MSDIKIDKASITTIDEVDYLMLKPSDWSSLRAARKFVKEIFKPGKTYIVNLKRFFNKRSLDSNAYAWKLINEIANELRDDKDEVYLDMLKKYGQSELFSALKEIDPAGYFKYYEEFGSGVVNGKDFTHWKVFKGSSEFDSREMSILISGIVNEAKELDIETLTPMELERLNSSWQAQKAS